MVIKAGGGGSSPPPPGPLLASIVCCSTRAQKAFFKGTVCICNGELGCLEPGKSLSVIQNLAYGSHFLAPLASISLGAVVLLDLTYWEVWASVPAFLGMQCEEVVNT